jgi:UDP-glucose:(heptosyl)LPS alpha-1,3-glucosyltransferase
MKILISRKDLRDTTSGVPKKVLQELKFFSAKGYEVFAIAETVNLQMIEEFGGKAIKTFRWPFSGYFSRKFYSNRVDAWIKKYKPQIVIGHGDILHQDILFIHNCVHLAHELIERKPLPENHEVGRIHTDIFQKGTFKLLICNSQMMKDDLIKRFYVDPQKAVVIYPEVNLSKFRVEDKNIVRKDWRQKFGFVDDDFVIGLVTSGNFKKRNLGLLIDAFKEISKENKKVKLFIAGGNIDKKYKEQAPTEGVVYAPPIIDVKNYYYILDVFVLPAHIEEFGRSVLESMFCGVPVITTSHVGASEILVGKSREFIMDQPKLEVLVELIKKLMDRQTYLEVSQLNLQTSLKYSSEIQNDIFSETLQKYGFKS